MIEELLLLQDIIPLVEANQRGEEGGGFMGMEEGESVFGLCGDFSFECTLSV